MNQRIVIAGGGAAGFFAAIACAEAAPDNEVILLEATAHPLAKVRVSGGGRCNVTHACFEPRELVKRYPRGSRELLGAFHRFQPRDTIAWFAERGVELKTEEDGRMFPTTDRSETIVECLSRAAEQARVRVRLKTALLDAQPPRATVERSAAEVSRFRLWLSGGEALDCDRLLIATGGNRSSAGWQIAAKLGHTIEPAVPSLFTFHVEDARTRDLAGVVAPHVQVTVLGTRLKEEGPLLITHWGMSGPAILKLSAWGARELHACDYRFRLHVNWIAGATREAAQAAFVRAREETPRRHVSNTPMFFLPQRLWTRLAESAAIGAEVAWTSLSKKAALALAEQLTASEFAVAGKSLNKEEFVTCGGVRLSEVDFRTMESRLQPGLHFAGEALDIDGVTGGFNFQAAWTTGRLAGLAMAGLAL